MNIFVLDHDPFIAAQMQCDKHVVKMVLESAQLLCGVHKNAPYRCSHKNHPCTLWAKKSLDNYRWLCHHGKELAREYTLRYGKVHASEMVIDWAAANEPNLPTLGLTTFPQCMPAEYKCNDVVLAYRAYYCGDKVKFAKWTKNRKQPEWWPY